MKNKILTMLLVIAGTVQLTQARSNEADNNDYVSAALDNTPEVLTRKASAVRRKQDEQNRALSNLKASIKNQARILALTKKEATLAEHKRALDDEMLQAEREIQNISGNN